jgi:hypothetical protein
VQRSRSDGGKGYRDVSGSAGGALRTASQVHAAPGIARSAAKSQATGTPPVAWLS